MPFEETHETHETQETHETDEYGQPIHIDIDPIIPTGFCLYC